MSTTPPSSPTTRYHIYYVDEYSPERYTIQGLDSSSDEDDEEENYITPYTYFASNSSPNMEMKIHFQHPFSSTRQKRVYTLFLDTFSAPTEENQKYTATFLPSQGKPPPLFSCNYQGRFSKVQIVTKGPQEKTLRTYHHYLGLNSSEFREKSIISSIDCSLKMKVNLISQEKLDSLLPKPSRARALFVDEPTSVEVQIRKPSQPIQVGALMTIESATVTFRPESP